MLSDPEIALVQKLGECFNDWCSLPGHHPMDKAEFASGVHRLQDMVGMRSAARCHPKEFPYVLGGHPSENAKSE